MRNRWGILAVLFVVRATMAFQFQSVAAVAPLLGNTFGVGLADVGILIGLYFAPGIVIALPGAAIGNRFGDKRTVICALLLMLAGGLIMTISTVWSLQIAGRLVAGIGGVILNVQMTKMVADWFVNREIATAMAIYVNSWPAGVALSLLSLPAIGSAYGISAVYLAVAAFIALGAVLLAWLYQAPPGSTAKGPATTQLGKNAAFAMLTAGTIWGLYNVGFATVFSFGPSMLVEQGWSITAAGLAISFVLWIAVISVPFGGFLADRINRHEAVLVAGCVMFALLMVALPRSGSATMATIVAAGLVCGLPAGPIMSLPPRVLTPGTRAVGMGLFYTAYYVAMMLGPVLAGLCAARYGSASAALNFGAAALLACPAILLVLNRITRRATDAAPSTS